VCGGGGPERCGIETHVLDEGVDISLKHVHVRIDLSRIVVRAREARFIFC
jgi:hypothetical protein